MQIYSESTDVIRKKTSNLKYLEKYDVMLLEGDKNNLVQKSNWELCTTNCLQSFLICSQDLLRWTKNNIYV